jgi:hypothetical protein
MKRPIRVYPVCIAVVLCIGLSAGALRAQTISTTSPFLPANISASSAAENSPIELRGILEEPNGSLFGLYDPVKRLGGWVKLNEAGHDFTVRSYDSSNDAVTVDYQGRVLTLALKSAKIESMPMMAQPQPNMVPRPPMGGPQISAVPTIDEAKRLEAVAAEVQRRRQMRQAAMQPQPQMPNQPPPPVLLPVQPNQPGRPGNGIGGNR